MRLTIQDVLSSGADSFLATYRLPREVKQAVYRLRYCRTMAMGFHVRRCPHGHVEQICYNSCKHRACPQCNWMASTRWLEVERERLLDCAHFHVVFTLPSELRLLWRWNREVFGGIFFQAAGRALLELLADAKYLGGKPGILLALHTWTQRLHGVHPHIHALVSGGGLTPDGAWTEAKANWLLPLRVLMHKFRGKLRALLWAALRKGKLQVPAGQNAARVRGLLNRLGRLPVHVKILEPYRHGRGVATYLARYLRGGPMSNRRLVSLQDGMVTFRYLDRRGDLPQKRLARVPVETFLYRYFQHVPPKHFVMVRRYGLYANNQRDALNQARCHLDQAAWEKPEPSRFAELLEEMGCDEPGRCPVCHAELICERPVAAPIRAPPIPKPNHASLPALI